MVEFAYRVRNTSGSVLSGVIEANEQRAAIDKLRGQKYIILEINEARKNPFDQFLDSVNIFKKKVNSKDLVLFSRQLSTLVSAGVPIVQGLSILTEQIDNPVFNKVVSKVQEDIEGGQSIFDALRKHPDAFTELYCSMVKAGEVGGILDIILERLSTYLEAAESLRQKVKGAMMYPLIVSIIAGGVTVFLLAFVIPTFKDIFKNFGAELPLPTQILINLSDMIRKYILLIIPFPIALFFIFKQLNKVEKFKYRLDDITLKLPMFGIILRKVAVAKFTRTLATLVKSGVPILQAMDTVAKTSGNKIIEEAINNARESVREGERIADPLKKSGVFPPMVTQMIAVGEETGNLDTMLNKIADFYDGEVDVAIKGLTSMIEPLVIVVMGVIIGAIVVAMFLPMFELGELASRGG
ncbi:MAG: type II secretion system F family protein [bacterium]